MFKTDNLGLPELYGNRIYEITAASADRFKKKNEFTTRFLHQLLEPFYWHSIWDFFFFFKNLLSHTQKVECYLFKKNRSMLLFAVQIAHAPLFSLWIIPLQLLN